MRKFLSLLLVLMLIPFVVPGGAKGLTNVTVNASPSDRNAYGEYKISFTLGKDLKTGYDYIYIQFPQESTIPCTSCAYSHCSDCFKINGVNAAGAGPVEGLKNSMYLRLSTILTAGSKVEVVISQSAAFQNPSVPGKYALKVWTSQEPEKMISNEFEITSTKIENLKINADPEFTNAKSKINITFKTGRLGNIQNGKYIYITFPEEFTLPQTVKKEFITVNTEIPTEVKISGKTISLKIPSSIANYRDVTINIYSSFGVINPPKKGTYIFAVWTDSETEPVTATVEIKEKDYVRTLIQTNPIEPDGVSGFFKSQVTVTLLPETNTQESMQTFYKIDEGEFKKYDVPFSIPEGIHTVNYYSKTNSLTEDAQSKTFKIDLTPPEFKMNLSDTTYTAENSFVISGSLSEQSVLYINGIFVEVKSDKTFAKEFPINNGENTFTLRTTDIVGNSTIKQVTVILDPTTPILTVESPKNWQQFKGTGILVKGSVYPENCNVYVNSEKLPVDTKGTFNYIYLPKKGETLVAVNITAVYSLTGKSAEQKFIATFEPQTTEIVLTIGKKEIKVDGKINLIDVAPFIDKNSNRTLVPIRFVSEFLGGTVDWNATTRTVTIKFGKNINNEGLEIELTIENTIVYVNGKEVKTDVAPLIKDSRTFVPLRFIAETMGFNVEWNSANRSIAITTP